MSHREKESTSDIRMNNLRRIPPGPSEIAGCHRFMDHHFPLCTHLRCLSLSWPPPQQGKDDINRSKDPPRAIWSFGGGIWLRPFVGNRPFSLSASLETHLPRGSRLWYYFECWKQQSDESRKALLRNDSLRGGISGDSLKVRSLLGHAIGSQLFSVHPLCPLGFSVRIRDGMMCLYQPVGQPEATVP